MSYKKPVLSEVAAQLAGEIADSLERGGYSQESFSKLCREIDSDEPPESFERFAVSIEDVSRWQFCDDALIANHEPMPEQITDEYRINYMRKVLLATLDSPSEDTPSAHWKEISISSQKSLYCCALVHIEGYSPITNWYGAYLSLDNFYSDLRRSGHVLSKRDVDLILDEQLLSYWVSND